MLDLRLAARGAFPFGRWGAWAGNRRLAAVRAALNLGRTLGVLNWTLEISNDQAVAYRDTAGRGEAAYRRMLAVADVRDATIIRLLHDLGLRRGELTGLDLAHVDLQTGRVSILEDQEWPTMPALRWRPWRSGSKNRILLKC